MLRRASHAAARVSCARRNAASITPDGYKVRLGRTPLLLGQDPRLQRLIPDNDKLANISALREALADKGYLYLQQLQPREKASRRDRTETRA